jgi:hypothetical protein
LIGLHRTSIADLFQADFSLRGKPNLTGRVRERSKPQLLWGSRPKPSARIRSAYYLSVCVRANMRVGKGGSEISRDPKLNSDESLALFSANLFEVQQL